METGHMQQGQSEFVKGQVVVLLLADIVQSSRWWGWLRIVQGSAALRSVPGLLFAKLLGSGHEGGFGLKPSASRQGLFALFESAQTADDFVAHAQWVQKYQQRSAEFCCVKLQTWSCRGTWDGFSLSATATEPTHGPVAALTRASIKLSKASAFWRHAPPSERALEGVQGCQLAVGLGEAPLLRQATFTIWDSVADMNAYARTGAHLQAIQSAAKHGYFSESMFARFVPLQVQGQWQGNSYA
jgi:heme-degrading monooxygenase HmoA